MRIFASSTCQKLATHKASTSTRFVNVTVFALRFVVLERLFALHDFLPRVHILHHYTGFVMLWLWVQWLTSLWLTSAPTSSARQHTSARSCCAACDKYTFLRSLIVCSLCEFSLSRRWTRTRIVRIFCRMRCGLHRVCTTTLWMARRDTSPSPSFSTL